MAFADSSTNLCSKCSGPLTFQPRLNLDLDLDTCSQPKMRGMIPLCNEDLDDYNAEIARLQAQRKRLIDYKTQIHFLLSSFHQFPNEVLCLIFESACVENVFEERPWPGTSPVITYLPALAISSVCTRWRSLALASPTLWSQIKLEIPSDVPRSDYNTVSRSPDEESMCSIIELYLELSIDTPLAISVESKGWDHGDSHALDLLLDHTYRWKSFAYTGEHCKPLDQLLGVNYHSFPILETVRLDSFGTVIPGRPDFAYFEDAPNLRSIRTGGTISDLPPAWNHLTSLDTRLSTEGEDLDLFHRYSALTVLKLRSQRTTSNPGITSLAKVESFTFVGLHKYDRTSSLLGSDLFSFTFPSLKELIILSEIHGPVLIWSEHAFSAFISRSACILTTLSLSKVEISDLNLIAALRLLPSLVKFNIDGLLDLGGWGLITTHFISSLNGSSTPPILPKLRYLYMKIHVTSFDDAVFIDMVSSRWLPSNQTATIGIDCLRSVVLHFSRRVVDEEVYKPLWQLDEMGMCVVVTGQ